MAAPQAAAEPLCHLKYTTSFPLVDVLWLLLLTLQVFTDLFATLPMRHDQVALY